MTDPKLSEYHDAYRLALASVLAYRNNHDVELVYEIRKGFDSPENAIKGYWGLIDQILYEVTRKGVNVKQMLAEMSLEANSKQWPYENG